MSCVTLHEYLGGRGLSLEYLTGTKRVPARSKWTYMHNPPVTPLGRAGAMTLVTLQTMACGCVAAIYRSRPDVVELELVEAKGPHCRLYGHRTGEVISLAVPDCPDRTVPEPTV